MSRTDKFLPRGPQRLKIMLRAPCDAGRADPGSTVGWGSKLRRLRRVGARGRRGHLAVFVQPPPLTPRDCGHGRYTS
jgi:hypothetical protein